MTTVNARPFGLIGHTDVLQQVTGFRGHSLLLAGPARVGKRPLGRVIAALQNCAQPGAPCGSCPSCLNLLHGTHPDLLELEPKTTTSTGKAARRRLIPVSAITERRDPHSEYERHVVEWLQTSPTYRRKVVLVDGAEFLNDESANALLKVVEEPPHGALFVFLSEDVSAVLPTIASRSTRLNVTPVPHADAQGALATLGENDPDLLAFAAGRPGVIVEREAARAALDDARLLHGALQDGMLAALEAAEALEKRFDPRWHPETLRFVLRHEPPAARAAADTAIARAEAAVEQYANAGVAFMLLALDLRAALGNS